jgi:AcrR family transcriptional regulator
MNPKQQQILEAAIQCVHEVGIEKTNAKLIAERLEMPTSLVFYYFPKQQQIFESIVMYIVTANNALVTDLLAKQAVRSAKEQLMLYVEGNFRWAAAYRSHGSVLLYGVLSASHDPVIKKVVQTAFSAGEERIYHMINHGVVEKEFSGELVPRETARNIHQMIVGSIMHFLLYAENVAVEEYVGRVKSAVLKMCVS